MGIPFGAEHPQSLLFVPVVSPCVNHHLLQTATFLKGVERYVNMSLYQVGRVKGSWW